MRTHSYHEVCLLQPDNLVVRDHKPGNGSDERQKKVECLKALHGGRHMVQVSLTSRRR